ncbi:hypothetical protein EES44_06820 [Streptomyces sp. ADI96-15]|nr:hypothetical protein EES44_06820 [Streptomyces sp. ADI96-15]
MVATSAASRSTSPAATGSPASATANSTGVSSCRRPAGTCPRCSASIRAYIDPSPKCSGRARANSVGSPRPSSARAACHRASSARPPPPPQSPEMRPRAGKRAVRPSGSMPAQLMPAPQTTATPRGAASSRRPARRTAKVSLRTSTDAPQPRAAIAAASCSSSTGRSALARQAETRATGRCPAASWARATASARASTAASTPVAGGRKPPPRAVPTTSPAAVTTATSVLLLPASMASTAPLRPTAGAPGCGRGGGR